MPKKQSGMAQDWTRNHAVPPRCRPNKNGVMYQLSYWAIPRKEFLIVLKSENFVPDMTPQPWIADACLHLIFVSVCCEASKNCQICSDTCQGTFKRSQKDLQVEIKHSERSKLQPYNCRPNKDQNLFVTSGCNEMYNITFSSQIATLVL